MAALNQKDIEIITDTSKRLVQDTEYYRYIFKKTEKIVSVVFYFLYHRPQSDRESAMLTDIRSVAQKVHDTIIQSLDAHTVDAANAVRPAALALIALQSKLQIAHSAGAVRKEVRDLFLEEIDSVLRAMNRYMGDSIEFESGEDTPAPPAPQKDASTQQRTRSTAPPRQKSHTPSETTSRRDRITTILEAKGETGIKDISDIITECSEKTIQRELNALIDEGVVKRSGKRRWSTYSLA